MTCYRQDPQVYIQCTLFYPMMPQERSWQRKDTIDTLGNLIIATWWMYYVWITFSFFLFKRRPLREYTLSDAAFVLPNESILFVLTVRTFSSPAFGQMHTFGQTFTHGQTFEGAKTGQPSSSIDISIPQHSRRRVWV